MAVLADHAVVPEGTPPTTRPLGVAILGAGMIAEVHRRAALVAGARVSGVLASTPDSTARAAARWGTRACSSLEEVLASDVDVVHICTPNSSTHMRATSARKVSTLATASGATRRRTASA